MSKIRELLNDKESVLVFDVDGVLAVMEWGEYNHYGEDDEAWTHMYDSKSNYYTEKYVSQRMQSFLKTRDLSNVYVITKAFCENEADDKKDFLLKYYGIQKENVYYVKNNFDKSNVLVEIKKNHPNLPDNKLIMIDDTVEVLTNIMDNTPFSTAHISSFLDDFWN